MCGIAGIFAYSQNAPKVSVEELVRIRDAMSSRGPDASGLWLSRDERTGLAHRRLSIIDLTDAGLQPMLSPQEQLCLVFNGEIYNYRELRCRLEGREFKFRSQSDTEVLLHLYSERGEAMVEDLRGMFSFVIWDSRSQSLFLARDPLGIKPLYYCDDNRSFRFASQVKALLSGRGVDTEPDAGGHVGFFLWGHVPEPHTLYRKIRSLPAGCSLRVTHAGPQPVRQFFSVTKSLVEAEACALGNGHHPRSAPAAVREALSSSVEQHDVSDVPVGLFLSSGTDSTAIANILTHVRRNAPVSTVTLACPEYRGTRYDESILAERTAQGLGCDHHTVWLSKADFQNDLGRLLSAMDQPTIDGVNSFFVSKAAKSLGLKVVMSGLGADEIFGGYPSFRQVPRLTHLLAGTRGITGLGPMWRTLSSPFCNRFASPKFAGLFEYGSTFAGSYLLRRALFMPWEIPGLVGEDLAAEGWRELGTMDALKQTASGITTPHLKVSALELSWYMRNQLLRDTDWASMAHSLEVRVPFVDKVVLKQLAPFIAAHKISDKAQLTCLVPEPVRSDLQRRKKSGFSIPIREWLLEAGTGPRHRGFRGWARLIYEQGFGFKLQNQHNLTVSIPKS
jgi:asparagine synthase (glutamine-hydrolysing)